MSEVSSPRFVSPNASLVKIRAGLRPVQVLKASDRDYFLFPVKRFMIRGDPRVFTCFQYRREIGEGHSLEERAMRRTRRREERATRRIYKRGRAEDLAAANA
jgi:hypothetical protein